MEILKLISKRDSLPLEVALIVPEETPKGIVQISHGMAEHKERYFPFMKFLADHGYIALIHDHRGHGASVRSQSDLGFFYTKKPEDIAEDLFAVTEYVQKRYPGIPVFLFSHSMGTMVARVFLQNHDNAVRKAILCGPPTQNPLSPVGIAMVRINALFFGMHHRSCFLDRLTFGTYARKGEEKNSWVCSDAEVLKNYASDPLCGYIFTNNGFLNLYRMMRRCFQKSAWKVQNRNLPVLVIAGADDPVIQNPEKFRRLVGFLSDVGYRHVTSKLYPGLRHELLNEVGKEHIWNDILRFLEESPLS